MRPMLLLPAALFLASCAEHATYTEILSRSKAEVSRRENWSDLAYIRIDQEPGYAQPTWRVTAGAFDYSEYPRYAGPYVVAGTERVLHFSRSGCLLSYGYGGSACVDNYYEAIVEPAPAPAPETDGK